MCGILTYVKYSNEWDATYDKIKGRVAARGPDFCHEQITSQNVWLFSSVLYMRDPPTKQPVVLNNGTVIQYNGELYNDDLDGVCDTRYMAEHASDSRGLPKTLDRFRGEYAFVQVHEDKIWFGRDPIGRRSLVYAFDPLYGLIISSVGVDDLEFREVPGGTVMCFDIKTKELQTIKWTFAESDQEPVFPYGRLTAEPDLISTEPEADLEKLLQLAVEARTVSLRKSFVSTSENPRLAVLFSGGLDCTLLAMLLDRVLPKSEPVDLLNVSFENKRTGTGFDTPDRILGRRSAEELCSVARDPLRFRFVEVNVPYEEMLEHRDTVTSLMRPKDSVMDLSIALAFYFASRGRGRLAVSDNTDGELYTSNARILFSGLGADELFAGYVRHCTRLRLGGSDSLREELQLDFDRLHERNLGRDDRVCSGWGKEVRYPFLDERVVAWAMRACPLDYKVREVGSGVFEEKYILRLIARRNGLALVSKEKKRAIQFGAKSAKMEPGQGKIKGTDKLV